MRRTGNISARADISVVIPVLNAALTLPACLATLTGVAEIIMVDGGSTDTSIAIAQAHNAIILREAASRGGQLRAGVAAAKSTILLLLHADTILAPDWADALPTGKAGYFRLQFASPRRAARMLEAITAWRCRLLALPYGDQGLLVTAALLREVGGIPNLPLMEDVELARRLGRNRLQALSACAVTSAARYEHHGFLKRPLRNAICLSLYFLGVPIRYIQKIYG